MSESFFILSGTMRLFDGRRWINSTSGDYAYVPVGGLHAFHNDSGEPASMSAPGYGPGVPAGRRSASTDSRLVLSCACRTTRSSRFHKCSPPITPRRRVRLP
ncbi:cupin domain-containing protein [Actinomadura sp. NAK00032]|uniref:cupin domain-containing protein n=1 Tax=Actinomadura sp. NAK00032 TaxID=2742128 RepID=UPI0020C7CFE7|nr:cupin domain-containing protein [Actinomadura sp. NAK00032]